MANFFPRSANLLPFYVAAVLVVMGVGALIAVPYFFTPKYTRAGYTPTQPVDFDHSLHAGQLGMDCRYCHSFVDVAGHSNVPTNEVCINCHGPGKGQVKVDSPKLAPVRDAAESGEPIDWVRVHAAPDYVYFNHSVHVNRGVSCASCHGKVNEMEVVSHEESLSMGWCLDCHRNPEEHVRPLDQVYNLDWTPEDETREEFYGGLLKSGASPESILGEDLPADGVENVLDYIVSHAADEHGDKFKQGEIGEQLVRHWDLSPPETCASCHR